MKTRTRLPAGFTLIEVLIVIAIIGLLVGLLLPAVNYAYKSVKRSAIVMEVNTLANAVEKYQQKYNDYPPDGSSQAIFQRHCLKIFPQMASSELADVAFAAANNQQPSQWPSGADPRVMDPTEALVFFLGGFSDDPVYPFTGPGGPIQVVSRDNQGNATTVQYNVDRNRPLYEFKQSQLTLVVTLAGLSLSNDESLYGLAGSNDALPAYRVGGLKSPVVYFDSRTYSSGGYISHFSPSGSGKAGVAGFARPYKSTQVNTSLGGHTAANGDKFYRYENEKTFQVISAGLDDDFGGVNPLTSGTLFSVFPTGLLLDITKAPADQSGPTGYQDVPGQPSAQLDNATNFSDGVLESAL